MKQYIGIIRDHSGSMQSITSSALKDYNSQIESIKSAALSSNIDTIVSVTEIGGDVRHIITNSSVQALQPISYYPAPGMNTPLFDGVGQLIEKLERVPDANGKDVSFLIVAITDGADNASPTWRYKISDKIRQLQSTDRWTFAFRVPRGYAGAIISKGVPAGNVQEWEQTEKGFNESTQVTTQSYQNYYAARSMGATSTKKFFVNVDTQKLARDVKNLDDISGRCQIFTVKHQGNIKTVIEKLTGQTYIKGHAYYELNKTERLQPQKVLAIRDKSNGKVFIGWHAREMLGLPQGEKIKVTPGYFGNYEIFVQSTSTNRILYPNQKVMYYTGH